jgi:hypothetical protein
VGRSREGAVSGGPKSGKAKSGKKMLIRCYDENDVVVVDMELDSPFGGQLLTDILQVDGPKAQMGQDYDMSKRAKNLVMALDNGRIYLYGIHPYLQASREVDVMNAHHGQINSLKKSYDNQIMVSIGQDGTIFVYKVSEVPNKNVGSWSRKIENLREKYDM